MVAELRQFVSNILLLFEVPLSGVSGIRVTNPTITTLTVTWNPADGNVQGYKVIYVPADGGLEIVVRSSFFSVWLKETNQTKPGTN